MYLVQYSTGGWDGWDEHQLFVTSDKCMADAYAEKMTRVGAKLAKYYNELYYVSSIENVSQERLRIILCKYYKWGDFNQCYVSPIEVR